MPRAQFEALERCQQAWHDWGVDSNESTVDDNNDNDDGVEDAGYP